MPLPRIQRGELWLVDLGYLGKVRPVLVAEHSLSRSRTHVVHRCAAHDLGDGHPLRGGGGASSAEGGGVGRAANGGGSGGEVCSALRRARHRADADRGASLGRRAWSEARQRRSPAPDVKGSGGCHVFNRFAYSRSPSRRRGEWRSRAPFTGPPSSSVWPSR